MRRPALLIATVALVSHLTALRAGFVWLDHAHIEDRAALGLRQAFTGGFAGTGYYRPLMAVSLSMDAAISGTQSAFLFHLTSLLLHALAAVMTMFAAGALGLSRRAALYAGVLFAVHPLTTLVADAIAFRSEAMIAVALLGLIWAHVREKPIAAALYFLFGALTKETALLLGPLFVLALPRKKGKRLFAYEGGALAIAVVLRLAFAPKWRAGYESLPLGDAIGTRLASLAKSTAAIVLPVDRSICDAFAVTHLWQPAAIAGLGVLGALAFVAYRQRGIALLLAIAILPALQIVPVTRWWSPHYLYVPLAFVAMLGAQFIDNAKRIPEARQKIVVAALATVLGALSIYDGARFADDTALWSPEVKKQPVCREGQFYLGEEDRKAKNWEAAARRYEAAIAPHPGILAYVDRPAALQNLGTVRLEQKRFADARRVFQNALEGTTDPQRRRELTYNLAAAAFQDGDPAECARLLEEETNRPDAIPEAVALRKRALERAK